MVLVGRESGKTGWGGWNESEKPFKEHPPKALGGMLQSCSSPSSGTPAEFGHLPCRTCRNIMENQGFSKETETDIIVTTKVFFFFFFFLFFFKTTNISKQKWIVMNIPPEEEEDLEVFSFSHTLCM